MPPQPQETQINPTGKNSSARIASTVLLVIAIAAFLFWVQRAREGSSIPQSLILDSRAEILYDEKSGNKYVKFESDKSGQELVSFYRNRLAESGWATRVDQDFPGEAHRFFVQRDNTLINIFIKRPPALDQITVSQFIIEIHMFPMVEGTSYP